MSSRFIALSAGGLLLAGCYDAAFAVRPIPRIAADSVGKPVGRLQDAFGAPRKIDTAPTNEVYVWFVPQKPPGAPAGFHGCEIEVTVDPRSEHVLGYSLSNIGWSKCGEVKRKIRIADS